MATLTLKKKISKIKKLKLAKEWLNNFPFYKNRMSPWKIGIRADIYNEYQKEKRLFQFSYVHKALWLRHSKSGDYKTDGKRVDICGNYVDEEGD